MLLSPSISTTANPNEIRINEYTSPNLPPILKSDFNQNCEAQPVDFPKFLEPTPLMEDSYFKKAFAASMPSEKISTELPPLASSSLSSYSPSEPSTPSTPAFDIPHWHVDLASSAKNSTPSHCRYTSFLRIKPKPDIKMDDSSYFEKSTESESSVEDESSPAVSPIMMAASTAAIAASNHSYTQPASSKDRLNGCRKTSNEDVFNLSTKSEKDNPFEVSLASTNHDGARRRSSAADRLMFLTKNAHIKRPRNAWIHFRCHYGQALKAKNPTLRAEEISKRASRRWALLTDKEKKPWNQLAEQDKQAHKEAFPNYKYCPRRSNSAAFFSKPTIIPVRELTGSSGPIDSKSTDHSDRKVDLDLDNIARRRLMRK